MRSGDALRLFLPGLSGFPYWFENYFQKTIYFLSHMSNLRLIVDVIRLEFTVLIVTTNRRNPESEPTTRTAREPFQVKPSPNTTTGHNRRV